MDKLAFVLGYTEGIDQLVKLAAKKGLTPAEQARVSSANARDTARSASVGAKPGVTDKLKELAGKAGAGIEAGAGKVGEVAGKAVPSLRGAGLAAGGAGIGGAAGAGLGYLTADEPIVGAGAGAGLGATLPKVKEMVSAPGWKAKILASLLAAGGAGAGTAAGLGAKEVV